MKTYQLKQGLTQNYANYSEEDKLVWKTLFERQTTLLEKIAASEYLEALNEIGFTANQIPDFRVTNNILSDKTGWSIEVVEGIISEVDFFTMLANKKFPATTWLRKLNQLDYLPEPDMFHDVFGHVPLLINKAFSDFFTRIGSIGLKHIDKPEVVTMLGRIYWYTIEFGLIKKEDVLQIYGAGIISSHGESIYSLSNKPRYLPFNIQTIMNTSFENDKIQEAYFVIDEFKQLYSSISEIESIIQYNLTAG